MSVGLSGSLADFSIADVFQLIGQQRKTGSLELRNAGDRAQLTFDAGLVVSARPGKERGSDLDPLTDRLQRCGILTRERAEEVQAAGRSAAQSISALLVERGWCSPADVTLAEDLITRDTIFEVLRWRSGSFDFRAEAVEHDRDPASLLGAEQILMDGLRMVDEWQSFAEFIPSERSVFQRATSRDAFVESSQRLAPEDRPAAERVYQLIDGRISVRRVIDLARLGTFDGFRILAELCRGGAIRALNPESVRQLRRLMQGSEARGIWLRGLAAAVPLLALAFVVGGLLNGAPAAPPPPGHPVEASGLDVLREAYASRAMRQAIEAYRLETGRWPARLSELEEGGWVESGALATPDGRPYYSVHRDRGLVFLAPERSPRGSR